MGEMKKENKKILDLPFGDNEFEIVDADEYIDTILYGNNEERENKTFKKLSREQKMVLKAIVQDEVTFYWQAQNLLVAFLHLTQALLTDVLDMTFPRK